VAFQTNDGSATTADNDYAGTSGTLTFLPGETSQPITVLVNGDIIVEADQDFTVDLSSPTNATLGAGSAQGVIQNDDVAGTVAARRIFYNQSTFDGNNASINTNDDNAIATDKSAYLPGAGVAVYNNITNYHRGINGIMIDIGGGGTHASIGANDFVFKVGNNNSPSTWAAAAAPSAISARTGAGVSGSDRVEITWAANAVKNTWLEVQVLATANTGLTSPDVFFWGNRVGDTTSPATGGTFITNVAGDGAGVAGASPASGVGVTNRFDVNKTNTINVAGDRAEVIAASPGSLLRINIGTGGPFAPEGDGGSNLAAAQASDGSDQAARLSYKGDTGIAAALADLSHTTGPSGESFVVPVVLPSNVIQRLDAARSSPAVLASVYRDLAGADDSHLDEDDEDDALIADELLELLAVAL
jgi:hypothetical protein